jgi:hypothetical protein
MEAILAAEQIRPEAPAGLISPASSACCTGMNYRTPSGLPKELTAVCLSESRQSYPPHTHQSQLHTHPREGKTYVRMLNKLSMPVSL